MIGRFVIIAACLTLAIPASRAGAQMPLAEGTRIRIVFQADSGHVITAGPATFLSLHGDTVAYRTPAALRRTVLGPGVFLERSVARRSHVLRGMVIGVLAGAAVGAVVGAASYDAAKEGPMASRGRDALEGAGIFAALAIPVGGFIGGLASWERWERVGP